MKKNTKGRVAGLIAIALVATGLGGGNATATSAKPQGGCAETLIVGENGEVLQDPQVVVGDGSDPYRCSFVVEVTSTGGRWYMDRMVSPHVAGGWTIDLNMVRPDGRTQPFQWIGLSDASLDSFQHWGLIQQTGTYTFHATFTPSTMGALGALAGSETGFWGVYACVGGPDQQDPADRACLTSSTGPAAGLVQALEEELNDQ